VTEQSIYSLAAACFGFVSALFLGLGSAITSNSKVVELVTPHWDYHEAQARAVLAQSSQYGIGALLLTISFCFQVLSVLAPAEKIHSECLFISSAWIYVPSLLAIISIPSYLLSVWIQRFRFEQVNAKVKRSIRETDSVIITRTNIDKN